jgi:hypothetical protein
VFVPGREVRGASYTVEEVPARPGSLTIEDVERIVNGDVANGSQVPNGPTAHGRLSLDEMRQLVAAHNLSGQPDELIIAVAWKESSFNPDAHAPPPNTATGLMQMNRGAIAELNKSMPAGLEYDHARMSLPVDNIEAGSTYLQRRIDGAGGNLLKGLNGYGTGVGYGDSIIKRTACLQAGGGGCF